MKKNIKKFIAVLALVAILIAGYFVFLQKSQPAVAGWFDDSWLYRQIISVANSGAAQTDFQVQLTVDTAALYTAGKIQIDCDDIRLTDLNGKLLDYWLEPNTCNTSATKVWVKMPSIPATTGAGIYLYYGNSAAVSASSTANTFIREISGVQGAWNMDEAAANTCSGGVNDSCDSSGNSNDGAWNGDATSTTGKFGNGTIYDGTGDYVDAGNGASLNITDAITIEAWVKQTATIPASNWPGVVSKSSLVPYGMNLNPSTVFAMSNTISIGGVKKYTSGYSGSLNIWYYAIITYDSSGGANNFKFYVNGNLISQSTLVGNIDSAPATIVKIGSTNFPGSIDEVRIYNTALSQSEITDLYGAGGDRQGYVTTNYPNKSLVRKYAASVSAGSPSAEERGSGPVAYWKFDEGFGQTANDSTINANNGTLGLTSGVESSDPTWQSEDMCVSGKCLKFDGVDDYVDGGAGSSLDITDAITIEGWVYLTRLAVGTWADRIFHKNVTSIFSNVGKSDIVVRFKIGGVSKYVGTGANQTLNTWHYFAFTYDVNGGSNNAKLYIDNSLQHEVTHVGAMDTSPAYTVRIGGISGEFFSGSIDSVRIYPYARTAAQIKADYMARGTAKGVSASMGKAPEEGGWMTKGLVGYWKMDEASWSGVAGEVLDASGAGNNGVSACSGTCTKPTTGTGKFGNGGVFDGVDDYVNAGAGSSLNITNAITVSAWVKADVVFSSRLGEGYTVKYEANELPESASPAWTKRGAEAATVSGGILNIVDTSTTSIRDYYRFWAMNRTTGSTILTRVKVNTTSFCGLGFYIVDGTSWATICIDNDSTDILDSSYLTYPVDNTIYNSYRITFKAGLLKIFLNENPTPILSRSITNTSGNNVLQFGSSAFASSVSTSDWDYVYYNTSGAYEPNDEQYLIYSIASKGEDAYAFEIRSGMLYGFINNGSVSTSIDTNWHYVTQTYDGSQHKLYVDGILKSSRSLTGAIATNSSNLTFGNYLDGSIDDVRIYNRALSPKEVRDLYNFAPGPVGWWKMDEKVSGNAKTLNDSSGYGNTGTTSSANGTGMDCRVPGKIGGGCELDGVDDWAGVVDFNY